MRFSLRTLLIVMLLAGPLSAYGWQEWREYQEWIAVQCEREPSIAWKRAIINARQVQTSSMANCFSDQIWNEQRDKISWESFPESQPPK